MSDIRDEKHDQKLPTSTTQSSSVAESLKRLIDERTKLGISKYGTPLMTHNGRIADKDALEEAVDLIQYQQQRIMERDDKIEKLEAVVYAAKKHRLANQGAGMNTNDQFCKLQKMVDANNRVNAIDIKEAPDDFYDAYGEQEQAIIDFDPEAALMAWKADREKIVELEAKVAKMAKTIDGKTVVRGDHVFHIHNGRVLVRSVGYEGYPVYSCGDTYKPAVEPEQCYSSLELAEAALASLEAK
jgi:hypothetical protein